MFIPLLFYDPGIILLQNLYSYIFKFSFCDPIIRNIIVLLSVDAIDTGIIRMYVRSVIIIFALNIMLYVLFIVY